MLDDVAASTLQRFGEFLLAFLNYLIVRNLSLKSRSCAQL